MVAFPETNVRKYVRYQDDKTGVWFLSLDAQCRPAVEVARWRWHLPYFWSRMSVAQNSEHVAYQSTRKDRRCQTEAEVEIEASLGEVIRSDSRHAPEKPPETDRSSELDRFLADRYALYSTDNYGTLYSGDVYHSLYPLRSADLIQCRQSLSAAAGVPLNRPPDHVVFSEGVTVDIFPLTPVQT